LRAVRESGAPGENASAEELQAFIEDETDIAGISPAKH
jgi:hypothetical protein